MPLPSVHVDADSLNAAAANKMAEMDAGLSPTKFKGVSSPSVVRSSVVASTYNIQSSIASESTSKSAIFCAPLTGADMPFALPLFSSVCVLDGRDRTFEINSDFYLLASKLPKFTSEIPFGSIAMVTYAASKWGENNLALSLNWVVVLSTPAKSMADRD